MPAIIVMLFSAMPPEPLRYADSMVAATVTPHTPRRRFLTITPMIMPPRLILFRYADFDFRFH